MRNFLLLVIASIAILSACTENTNQTVTITYPFNDAVFPPEFPASSIRWEKDSTTKNCLVELQVNDSVYFSLKTDSTKITPDIETWNTIKKAAKQELITCNVSALNPDGEIAKTNSIQFKFSKDSVGAPIFFRSVILPFSVANQHKDSLKWNLGSVASADKPKVLLTNIPVCANCHSFPKDGSKLAMDIDNSNNKGSYTIMDIKRESEIDLNTIMTWDEYKKEDGEKTFGLLAQISPDGKKVVSMVKDRSIFVPIDNNFAYSQLFFPIKGILVSYDIESGKFMPLSGADDKNYVQASPSWSHDGKTIAFSKALRSNNKELDTLKTMLIDPKYAREFIDGKKDFKFDLYHIPFNNGKGGVAEPIKGASNNGKSNYFAKYSPDGKWIVFTQSENFMLLQKDSKLVIIPAEGGEPRVMNCNTNNMNSWHSWSPNGKWLVFATKDQGPYTQLYMTHIDENGNDSPPIWLEHFDMPNNAINIPEFVNIDFNSWNSIKDGFTSEGNYFQRAINEAVQVNKDNKKALRYINLLIETNPEKYKGYIQRGDVLIQEKNRKGLDDYSKAIELINIELQSKPKDVKLLQSKAYTLSKLGKHEDAIAVCDKILSFSPNDFESYKIKLTILLNLGDKQRLLNECSSYLKNNPTNYEILYLRSKLYEGSGQNKEAISEVSKLLELNKNNGDLLLRRSFLLYKTEQYQKSLDDVTKVIEQGMFHYSPFYLSARNKFKLGNNKGALEDINKAIEMADKILNADPQARERRVEMVQYKTLIENSLK